MKMKKKGFKAGGMKKKGYAMGKMVGMKKKGFAAGKAVKPDFPDVDGDGDRTEPISQAQGQLQGKKDPVKKAQGKMVNMKKKGYAKGKMVKKGAANGGKKNGKAKVRGAGIARKGVRPAKMR